MIFFFQAEDGIRDPLPINQLIIILQVIHALARRLQSGRQTQPTEGAGMSKEVIQDWTDTTVVLKFGRRRDVRYQVYRDGERVLQEIRDDEDRPIHTLELPEGLLMERQSYEVLVRYVLLDIVPEAARARA